MRDVLEITDDGRLVVTDYKYTQRAILTELNYTPLQVLDLYSRVRTNNQELRNISTKTFFEALHVLLKEKLVVSRYIHE